MAFTAYAQLPPDGMGDYLAGRDSYNGNEVAFEEFHRTHLVDARLSDCRQPERPELHRDALFERQPASAVADLRFHRRRRFVYCPDGHRVKLDRRGGASEGYHFRHWPADDDGGGCRFKPSAAESPEHKTIKQAAASVFSKTGATTRREHKSVSLRSQPDITADLPDGRRLGIEVQTSDVGGEGTAARRTRYLTEDGYTPIWMTTLPAQKWQQRVPCVPLLQPRAYRGDETYYATVRRIAYKPCERRCRCWYKRWTGLQECPGHYVGARLLNDEDRRSGRQERDPRIRLDEFARMMTSGELVVARVPHPSLSDHGLPVITYADDDGKIAQQHFNTYLDLLNSRCKSEESVRERLPYCSQKMAPRLTEDTDQHGEHDARIQLDREYVRRERDPERGEWVSFVEDHEQRVLSGRVCAVHQDDYGRRSYGIRYWREIKESGIRRSERGEDVVSADRILSIE